MVIFVYIYLFYRFFTKVAFSKDISRSFGYRTPDQEQHIINLLVFFFIQGSTKIQVEVVQAKTPSTATHRRLFGLISSLSACFLLTLPYTISQATNYLSPLLSQYLSYTQSHLLVLSSLVKSYPSSSHLHLTPTPTRHTDASRVHQSTRSPIHGSTGQDDPHVHYL